MFGQDDQGPTPHPHFFLLEISANSHEQPDWGSGDTCPRASPRGYTTAEYDWTVCALRRFGFVSCYFDHL